MTLDLDIALKIAEILSILGGGGLVAYRLGRTSARVEAAMASQGNKISTLEEEIKTLNRVVTEVALQNQRLDSQDKRIDMLDHIVDDLRRGEGMILPLTNYLRPAQK